MAITSPFGGVSLGPDTSGNVKLNLYNFDVAVKTPDGTFLAYEKDKDIASNDHLVEVDGLILDGMSDFIYKRPVRSDKIERGDLILASDSETNPIYYFAMGKVVNNALEVFDVQNRTRTTYVQPTNPFAFSDQYYIKYESLFAIGGEDRVMSEYLLLQAISKGTDNPMALILLLEYLRDEGEGARSNALRSRGEGHHFLRHGGISRFWPFLLKGQTGDLGNLTQAIAVKEFFEEEEKEKESVEVEDE